jgi:transposase-like protein
MRHKTTAKTRDELLAKLREVLIKRPDGFVEYPPGVTDNSIAQELGVSPHSVSYYRIECHGRFAPPEAKAAEEEADTLAALKRRLDNQAATINRLLQADEELRAELRDIRSMFGNAMHSAAERAGIV